MKKATAVQRMTGPIHLEFFSPSPAGRPAHLMDIAAVKLLNKFHPKISASWRAIPAPDHIDKIDSLPTDLKKYSLPIVPSTDFMPARLGQGPAWHRYLREHKDLKFVGCTSVVAVGVATCSPDIRDSKHLKGRKIGVMPRPSSFRILMEGILRDGWEIEDQVDLKDIFPAQVKEGLLSGGIDATINIQTAEIVGGFQCFDSGLLAARDIHWVNISVGDIERINRNNSWKLHRVLVPRGSIGATGPRLDPPADVGMAGFSAALCAWDDTEDEVVYDLVRFLDEKAELWPEYTNGCPLSLARMSRFPGISEEMVHPGALKYYSENDIRIGEPVQLRR
ncbi:MAG: TAXI family TRAP transporter solute-binding subunit [Pseudomonadota bacterium]